MHPSLSSASPGSSSPETVEVNEKAVGAFARRGDSDRYLIMSAIGRGIKGV